MMEVSKVMRMVMKGVVRSGKCGVWDVDLVNFKLFWCFDL